MVFIDKVTQAYDRWANGEVYICPVCDGMSQICDADYQSSECELIEKEKLNEHTQHRK